MILNRLKRLSIVLSFFSCFSIYSEPQEPTTLFLGNIKFPKSLNHNDLCLYYKGQKLATDWDQNNLTAQYSFLESKTSQALYILICNNITCHTKLCNTIQHLQLTNDEYRCYELQATRVQDELGNINFSWDCQECDLEHGIIPDNTLIFLFDPFLFDTLQVHTWNKNQAMRLIPTINISHSATASEIMRTMTISRLTAIDIDTIHAKECSKNKTISKK